jgi:hypothetical protein
MLISYKSITSGGRRSGVLEVLRSGRCVGFRIRCVRCFNVALRFPSTRGQLGVQALVIGQSLETARSLPAPLQGLVPFSSQGVGIGPFRVGTVRIR